MLDKWELVHKYRRASARDIVVPLTCDYDGAEMVLVVGLLDEPAIKCLTCRTVKYLGLMDLELMEMRLR